VIFLFYSTFKLVHLQILVKFYSEGDVFPCSLFPEVPVLHDALWKGIFSDITSSGCLRVQ